MSTGSWCWFSNPRVHYSSHYNRTYFGWVAADGSVMARQIDHNTDADVTVTLHAALNVDDHANPAFLEMPDGRIFIFYSHHQDSDIRCRATINGDISSLGVEVLLGVPSFVGASNYNNYANPIFLAAENRVFVFFRQDFDGHNRWCVAINENGLATWSWTGYPLWDLPNAGPYAQFVGNGVDSIDLLLTTDHPFNAVCDIYHARYRYLGGGVRQWQSGQGTQITAVPFGKAQASKVINGADFGNVWIQQIAYGVDGVPLALFDNFVGNSVHDHRYRYMRLDYASASVEVCSAGDELVSIDPASGYYSGGACFDGNDPTVVYAARQDATGWRIDTLKRQPDGSWSATNLSPATSAKQYRPYSPQGYPSNAPFVLWFSGAYAGYLDCTSTLQMAGYRTKLDILLSACQAVTADPAALASVKDMASALQAYAAERP